MKYLVFVCWCQMYLGNKHRSIQHYTDNVFSKKGLCSFMDDAKQFTIEEATALVVEYNKAAAMEPYWAIVPYPA